MSKRFGGVPALQEVSFEIEAGTIHGLVGENGAGKSTLGKIIGGALTADEGDLLIGGRPVVHHSPRSALAQGIAVIQQELALVPALSVVDNVFLGVEKTSRGVVDRATLRQRYEELEERVQFGLPADRRVGSLRVADQQKVEILRALGRDAWLIVMDEPTSSLTTDEALHLHSVVKELRQRGLTVVYVSHFLHEVLDLADTVTVLRNGRHVETKPADRCDAESLVLSMLGKPLDLTFPSRQAAADDAPTRLSVSNLSRGQAIRDVSFDVRRGEILGIAGLVGSGRTEVLRAIFGADRPDSGTIRIDGAPIDVGSSRRSVAAGVGFVPEDRKTEGLLLELSQQVNVTLPHLATVSNRFGVISRKREAAASGELLSRLRVTGSRTTQSVLSLSGGNQQKVLFAKWLMHEPGVLLLDEPTRGVDVGAKQAIYELIVSIAAKGTAVVLVSSELEEALELSHRVVVMRRGSKAAEFSAAEVSPETVMNASFGVTPGAKEARA